MSYKVSTTIESEGVQSDFMPVGIHENVELVNIRAERTPNGNNFIEFTFQNENGETVKHTEWEPMENDPIKLEEKRVKQIKRLKQIVTKIIPENEYSFEAPDFTTFCAKTISLLNNRYTGKKLRIKVVYNNRNFTSLPNYAAYQFIESMSVPKEKSKIKILALDKMVTSAPNYDGGKTHASDLLNLTTSNDIFKSTTISTNNLPY